MQCYHMINSVKKNRIKPFYQKTNIEKPVNIHYVIDLQEIKSDYNPMYSKLSPVVLHSKQFI